MKLLLLQFKSYSLNTHAHTKTQTHIHKHTHTHTHTHTHIQMYTLMPTQTHTYTDTDTDTHTHTHTHTQHCCLWWHHDRCFWWHRRLENRRNIFGLSKSVKVNIYQNKKVLQQKHLRGRTTLSIICPLGFPQSWQVGTQSWPVGFPCAGGAPLWQD